MTWGFPGRSSMGSRIIHKEEAEEEVMQHTLREEGCERGAKRHSKPLGGVAMRQGVSPATESQRSQEQFPP